MNNKRVARNLERKRLRVLEQRDKTTAVADNMRFYNLRVEIRRSREKLQRLLE